jgi:hypothetical protein
MKKLLIIFALLSLNVTGQTINWVKYQHQSDIKVYVTPKYMEANLIIFRASYQYQSTQIGFWYWQEKVKYRDKRTINVYSVKYKYQADYIVYFCDYRHQVRVTKEFENLIENLEN